MISKIKSTIEKDNLHSRNKHRQPYNFNLLIACCPDLEKYVHLNLHNNQSIDFFNPDAVKILNKALLKYFYNIDYWDIPTNYLCPPVPGRADYIHYIADLLSSSNNNKIPLGNKIHCLDIGVGANCIYPIIGNFEYGWSFTGTEIDPISIKSANAIINNNSSLKNSIEIRIQKNTTDIFNGIIKPTDFFDVSICNPPFHSSFQEAQSKSTRKLSNLKHSNIKTPLLNFGGKSNELWCKGGEEQFIKTMINQSKEYEKSCHWFTTLVSKQSSLKNIYFELQRIKASKIQTIQMSQGNKISRIVAWTFFN